jgi:hypothetical protein
MLTVIAIWALVTFLAWLFVYGTGRASESNSLERAEHDTVIDTHREIPAKNIKSSRGA